jgi:hypothetical protein
VTFGSGEGPDVTVRSGCQTSSVRRFHQICRVSSAWHWTRHAREAPSGLAAKNLPQSLAPVLPKNLESELDSPRR